MMPRGQYKNTIKKSDFFMSPPKPRYPTTTNLGYPNETEAQEENHNPNLIKMIEIGRAHV